MAAKKKASKKANKKVNKKAKRRPARKPATKRRAARIPGPEARLHAEIAARIDAAGSPEETAPAVILERLRQQTADAIQAESIAAEAVASWKAKANATKAEIADWKAWLAGLPEERTVDELPKLEAALERLAGSLSATEARIAAAVGALAHARGAAIAVQAAADAVVDHGPKALERLKRGLAQGEAAAARERVASERAVRAARATTRGH
ncbi:MAG: hypothetical protein KDE27_21690 [Planctomycetes bacterium]|nr:hypothetical protein [Planctomycetota bacterium]